MMMFRCLVLLANLCLVLPNPFVKEAICQKACHPLDDTKINVHLVSHSHDDVGWLRTYQQYYDGTGNFDSIANAGVSYILNSTIAALAKNPDRRFIQVETAFFYKWWQQQTEETRNLVRDLLQSGRLEMINGGWSMNDEAAAHYHSIIDQFTWGFRILEDTVGECGRPKIGWQIDPFGHSREHASIVKQLGFEGLIVGRIDYRDKNQRIDDQNVDFVWNTNPNFEDANLFTTTFPDFYIYEPGFCFDIYCNDEELNDDNLQRKVEEFTGRIDRYKNFFRTRNIMLPMGHDFSYQVADKNFDNIDKLIEGFQDHDTYHVFYSTPSCYIDAVQNEVAENNIELKVKEDDFFPYASGNHDFWTGYFTSRPTSKRDERTGNNILQSAKQLTTFSRIQGNDDDKNILELRMAMGIFQHHDAITGTEKQAVANDYSLVLNEAIGATEETVSNIIINLLKKEDTAPDLDLQYCLRANMSICDNSKKDRFVVAIHNPLSKVVSEVVRLPVDGENYQVTGPEEDGEIAVDVFDTINSFDFVTDGEPASKELVFVAKNLPPLGLKLYYVEKIDGSDAYHPFEDVTEEIAIGDNVKGITIGSDGKLNSVTINEQTINVKQDFYYYNGYARFNDGSEEHRASGAYIFRPDGPEVQITDQATVRVAVGSVQQQVLQQFNSEVTQIIKVTPSLDAYIEFDWLVGDLQIGDSGKEIITRYSVADFASNELFYTDSNGRQQLQRKKNSRNDYSYDPTEEPVASNYYPVTARIVIRDEEQGLEVAVVNDRAQGGTSLNEGEIELMLHRRDIKDDAKGVDEALNEVQYDRGLYARGQHYFTFGSTQNEEQPVVFQRDLARRKLLAPIVLIADATADSASLDQVQDALNFKYEALTRSLPENTQILTLEPWKDSYLLRLEHIFEVNEDAQQSTQATVDLSDLFNLFTITELTPVSLGANQVLDTKSSSIWHKLINVFLPRADPDLTITLEPMEIKTFLFTTNQNNDGGHDNGIDN